MNIVDVNVLLYAINDRSPHHREARAWWGQAMNGSDTIGLPWIVMLGFLRLATHGRVFPRPLAPEAAAREIDVWLAHHTVRVVREKDDHWSTLHSLLKNSGTAGNLTTDAHLAALAISHDATLVSCDADFARFKGLRWLNPLA